MGLDALAHDRIGKLRLQVPFGHALQPPPELRALELHPSGLPRSAIVVLRCLRVVHRGPLAGARAISGSAWREAAHGAVNGALRNAVRPIDGAVSGRCNAVVFADMAELLACLARDWLDGSVAEHWWWRELLEGTPTLASICAAWLDNAPALGAACALLRDEGRLAAFIALWPAPARMLLLERALVDLRPAAARPVATDGEPRPTTVGAAASRGDIAAAAPLSGVDVGTVPSTVKPTLHSQAPPTSEVQTSSRHGIIVPGLVRPPAAASIRTASGRVHSGVADDEAAASAVASADVTGAADDAPPALLPASPSVATRPDPTLAAIEPDEAARPESRSVETPALAAFEIRANEPDGPGGGTRTPSSPTRAVAPSPAPRFASSRVQTDFGGLFYLLNVALHLDLYADFTQPRRAGLALSPWDLLAWIGRRWFGRTFERDPLWPALASWSGREPGDDPAAGFVAPAPWKVADAWLLPFGRPASLTLRCAGDRVLLRHPAGFSVFDLDATSAVRLPALDGIAFVERPSRRAAPGFGSEGQRWLAHLSRLVRARCALALQVPRRDVPALVAHHPAQVVTTPATVEVHLSLAGLPLPVRLAGLDRDPGWLPAAGRSLRFVFE